MANTKIFGYARVSSKEQNLDRQIAALTAEGIMERDIFTDKLSGKDFNRPQYQALRAQLREGDTVVILSLDRLGRNYDDIKTEWEYITKTVKANIKVIDMPILDTTNTQNELMGKVIVDVVLSLLSYVANEERNKIRSRQEQGIKSHRKKFSKEHLKIQAPKGFEELFIKAAKGETTHTANMRALGLNKTTYYRLANDKHLKSSKKVIGG